MTVMVDTSVWSLALRRDRVDVGAARRLEALFAGGEDICATGLILQELLQGFGGPKQVDKILEAFASIPLVVPAREDHPMPPNCAIDAGGRASRSAPSTR